MLVVQHVFCVCTLSLFSLAPYLLKIRNILAKKGRKFVGFKSCLCPEALSILLTKWLRIKGGSLPPPPPRRVSRAGESEETVMNGAAPSACSGWDAGVFPPFLAQRTLCGCVMAKPLHFRKKKRGRKLCKTEVSQTATLSLYMVLLNGGEVWEQGNQEGVLVALLLLAEPVTQIPVVAVAVSPPQAAHGNHPSGPRKPGRTL